MSYRTAATPAVVVPSSSRAAVAAAVARSFLLTLLFSLLLLLPAAAAAADCRDDECAAAFGEGSRCVAPRISGKDGANDNDDKTSEAPAAVLFCSNPFAGGCLQRKLPEGHKWKKKRRVCNSNDDLGGTLYMSPIGSNNNNNDDGNSCIPSPFGEYYAEVRIASGNWHSVLFEAWLLQIVLGELLGVPATVETGHPHSIDLDLYRPELPLPFSATTTNGQLEFGDAVAYDWDGIQRSSVYNDCRKVKQKNNGDNSDESYESCSHVIPELWDSQASKSREMVYDGVIEPTQALGVLGEGSWFVPKFTAVRDPSLTSYLGLAGPENRRKLAEAFKRPTTWRQYCDEVSATQCSQPDDVARRAPRTEQENDRMFVEGLYTGYFRMTDDNDCDTNPGNCTGHFADYPCGWTSFVQSQTHHLDIALKSEGSEPNVGGYKYDQLTEIISAANATRSDIIFVWWSPDVVYQSYLGTPAEFHRVVLPPPTQQCIDARIRTEDRCSDNETLRIGVDPAGACDTPAQPLTKAISTGLYDAVYNQDPPAPDAALSPAHEVATLFSVSGLNLGEMFDYAKNVSSPRNAICQWAVDHLDYLEQFIPRSYPRVPVEKGSDGPLIYTAVVLGAIATMVVLISGLLVYRQRKRRVMIVSQIEFLALLLSGLLIVGVGSIVVASPPTNASCVAAVWLINVGYTVELVPLIVKVAAINRLMNAAQRCRRVVLRRSSLFGAVLLISGIVVVFMIVWTVLDPPRKQAELELTNEETQDEETIVSLQYFCDSASVAYEYISMVWLVLLLITATIIAFLTRNVRQDFNEAKTLGLMCYSHFVFLVLRLIAVFLSGSVSDHILTGCRSLTYSADVLVTMGIYFFPKFLVKDQPPAQGGMAPSNSLVARSMRYVVRKTTPNGCVEEPQEGLSEAFGARASVITDRQSTAPAFSSSSKCRFCGESDPFLSQAVDSTTQIEPTTRIDHDSDETPTDDSHLVADEDGDSKPLG